METQKDFYQRIKFIANSENPVDKSSPIWNIFNCRKLACEKFEHTSSISEEKRQLILDMIEHYNDLIRKYLML